jgi:tetratricopeptide (TPR) repeat protein
MSGKSKAMGLCVFLLAATIGNLSAADLLTEGERLFMENKPAEAIPLLEQYLKSGYDERGWGFLGLSYVQIGKLDEAVGAYRKGLSNSVRLRHYFLYNIGNCFFMQEKNAFAEDLYGQAIENKSDYASAYLGRANVRMRLGKLKDAVSDYTIFLTLDPTHPEAENVRRLLSLMGEDLAAAEKAAAEEAARKLAEEAAKKALLESMTQSLKSAAEDMTNISGGTDDPRGYDDDLQLED